MDRHIGLLWCTVHMFKCGNDTAIMFTVTPGANVTIDTVVYTLLCSVFVGPSYTNG